MTILHSFTGSGSVYPYSKSPLVQGSDGNFYGTTHGDSASDLGTFYSITPAGVFATLHGFTGTDGEGPGGALVQGSDGTFHTA